MRDGVLKEIEKKIDEDPDKIVPVSLDELWKEKRFRIIRGGHSFRQVDHHSQAWIAR